MNILKQLYKVLSSYGLAVVVLVFMTIVTLVGTLDQVHLGLWGAMQEYFHSKFITTSYYLKSQWGIPLPIFLPGGMLLMFLLFINMTLGAIVHVRKRARGIPNLISHLSILFLLVSAFITYQFKNDGYVALFPGQSSNTVHSYKFWQVEILEFDDTKRPTKAHVIPWERLISIGEGAEQEFVNAALPFQVRIGSFLRNAEPVSSSNPSAINREVNGLKLMALKTDPEVERNLPGCFATVLSKDGEKTLKEIILTSYSSSHIAGNQPRVAGFQVDGKQYGLQLVKKNWKLPYYIKLEKFIFDKHPGTDQPKNYESRITRLKDGESEKVAIRMNQPMRHEGFVVFQESFGDPRDEGKYFSQFAVSDNPSDKWPEYALWLMMIGLTVHFFWKLIEYISKSSNRVPRSNV